MLSRTSLRNVAIVAQVAAVLSFPLWLLGALFAVMLFDNPDAGSGTWILFYTFWAIPFLIVIFSIGMWVCYRKEWHQLVLAQASLLILSAIVVAAMQV